MIAGINGMIVLALGLRVNAGIVSPDGTHVYTWPYHPMDKLGHIAMYRNLSSLMGLPEGVGEG